MKSLQNYIVEAQSDKQDPIPRADIKFTIWEDPKKQVRWLTDNNAYQKIEYQYKNTTKNIFIDYLLGFKDDSWQLWAGKIGRCTYDDDPYCDLKTSDFAHAINNSLDKIEQLLQDVLDDPQNYVQYYREKPSVGTSTEEGGDEDNEDKDLL